MPSQNSTISNSCLPSLYCHRTVVRSVVMPIAPKCSNRRSVWVNGDDVASVDQAGNKAKDTKTDVDDQVHGQTSLDGHRERREENRKQHHKPVASVHFVN